MSMGEDVGQTGMTEGEVGELRKRRITLEDCRYLIFYTFGEGAEPGPAREGAKAEPAAVPVAEEERRV
jgi:hypothetical protein